MAIATLKGTGQVLVFFALVVPIVLLPVAAYVVDSAVIAARHASLQAATAEAAEIAAQRIDVAAVRSSGTLRIDDRNLRAAVAGALANEEPAGMVESVTVAGTTVSITALESVPLPVPLLGRSVLVRAVATARIVPGYDSPSSFFPFPTRTF